MISTVNIAEPQKRDLYRLPWSNNDNPIGWVEITDICNISCKGCYRMIIGEGHKSKEKIEEEVLFLKKWRNCDNITLAGGEPLLHPKILDIVNFIAKQGLKCVILTNGYALTDAFLKKLKDAGLMGLSFHIDATQIRPEFRKQKIKSELELNPLRLHYAKMLRKYKLYAHFGITVTPESISDVPDFIQWGINNVEYVCGLSLIIYRGLPITNSMEYYAKGEKVDISVGNLGYAIAEEEMSEIKIKSPDVYKVIKEAFPEYDVSCYLGGTADHTSFKWLIGNAIVMKGGLPLGAFGKKALEFAQVAHHWLKGSYLVYPRKRIGRIALLGSLLDTNLRKTLKKYLKVCVLNPLNLFKPIWSMGIGIVQAPDVMENGTIDMCDDCPDMCVHEGKLVNSCRLDECRIYGDLLLVHRRQNGEEENSDIRLETDELIE